MKPIQVRISSVSYYQINPMYFNNTRQAFVIIVIDKNVFPLLVVFNCENQFLLVPQL